MSGNYDRFALLAKKSARKQIPQGCRKQYIPGLSKESSKLYKEYVTKYDEDTYADSTAQVCEKVLESISQEHSNSWQTLIESTDMSKNSKNAWSTIHKLHGHPRAPVEQPKVTANQVATQFLLNSKNGKMRLKIKLNHKSISKTLATHDLCPWKSWKSVFPC